MPDIFLKFDPEIQGGSDSFKFAKYIEILSFSWGLSNPPFDGKGDLPAVQQTVNLSGAVDRQSPRLFEACAQGKPFETAELSVVSEGGEQQVFYKLLVSDVVISSYQVGGSEAAIGITESYALSFREVRNEFSPQRPDGTLEPPIVGSFDFGEPKKE
jgi:type VI secretion system secreted protein Hcp